MTREELLTRLSAVFHQYGYDGATLARLSAASGLGKGSLYHHFPGGKEEIGVAVLQAEGLRFHHLLAALQGSGDIKARLALFAHRLRLSQAEQLQASTLDVYSMGDARARYGHDMRDSVLLLTDRLSVTLQEAGLDATTAHERAYTALALIEGMRLTCRCLGDWSRYDQLLDQLPGRLLTSA
ncbi:transcriptional regulator, TetR family [Andreprevotia lacus DSM 23236]|jgi:AcrR family transcriptional regulator|uniref:Transcriptional regulator, TetR family n=1 Tax=Andreprevotia lacus DSM 23236 TaxID=1121001 RepID=A0A1W1WZI1_9NEIS|nr:TetR/AcrR family transcriptional regulator [Andreprevotia lacus]SMC17055.1 transcriptional regulator, TetR family [Andreprevotia lacus DSM 23236]